MNSDIVNSVALSRSCETVTLVNSFFFFVLRQSFEQLLVNSVPSGRSCERYYNSCAIRADLVNSYIVNSLCPQARYVNSYIVNSCDPQADF